MIVYNNVPMTDQLPTLILNTEYKLYFEQTQTMVATFQHITEQSPIW